LALSWIGMPLSLLLDSDVPGMPAWPKLVALGIAGILTLFLAVRRFPTVQESSAIFLLNNLGALFALWMTSGHYAITPRQYVPFQSHQLAMLCVALIAPGQLWVGALTIALYSGAAVVQHATFAPGVRDRMSAGEPMTTLFFALFALCLLYYRSRRQALAAELDRAHGEAEALKKVARRLLAVRDLANTPLQTIEANTALIDRLDVVRPYAGRIQRSLDRLRRWQELLDEEATRTGWGLDETAFDPRTILERSD
jgi:hypothetical protein